MCPPGCRLHFQNLPCKIKPAPESGRAYLPSWKKGLKSITSIWFLWHSRCGQRTQGAGQPPCAHFSSPLLIVWRHQKVNCVCLFQFLVGLAVPWLEAAPSHVRLPLSCVLYVSDLSLLSLIRTPVIEYLYPNGSSLNSGWFYLKILTYICKDTFCK
jgi:hypothetical protein